MARRIKRIAFLVIALCLLAGAYFGRPVETSVSKSNSFDVFDTADQKVEIIFGFAEPGEYVPYVIVRSWPLGTAPETTSRDSRVRITRDDEIFVRDESGRMVKPCENGCVYFYRDDRLDTMKVRMNKIEDREGIDKARSYDRVWAFLERFRISSTSDIG